MANQQMISAAASSCASSSSSESLKKYDVFLSFRGEDTRSNFTSHLYDALIQKKVETYIDYELQKGDEISPALIKAIEESHASVVIFSENYASSKWCLDEISKILECKKDQGQVVIPVFYNTDPSHVRKQTGSYKQAFAKHEEDLKCNKDKVHKWKAALTEAANLAGWDSRTYRTESEFIKDIVKDVLQKLNLRYPFELKGLVGIDGNYAQIESLLEIGSREVRLIGIWGMGGIGKTTLAAALYAKFSFQFEGDCFLANVREEIEKHGVNVLRKRLFSELLEEENLRLGAPRVESHFVVSRLRRKKVFVVLDDVATSEQLEDLISDYDCLGLGSRVIVTTRDKHIFSQVDEIYEVKELNFHDSLQLFCLNAFKEKHPTSEYEELSKSVIAYCKGIPLALKVLGSRLRSRSKQAWESELRKLQKIPDVKIHNVLRLSYNDLDRTQKDIFLDIACFLKGESRDFVIRLLEACNFFATIGIEVLLDKALITISNGNKIEMHDLIQEMGWEIVHQECIKDPGRRSRLWDTEEVFDVLKYNKGTEAVEGIMLDVSKIEDLHLSLDSFAKMTNIRYLKFFSRESSNRCNVYLPNGLMSLSDKLRYLQWHGYCLESLPSTFCAKMLVELSMPNSHLEKLWDGVQDLVNLKQFDLSFSEHLIEVPDLSMAENLEGVSLVECKSLHQVHPSILSLQKLKFLDLDGCTQLESLQTDIGLESLNYLRLSNCSTLKEFSVTSKEMLELWLDGTLVHEVPSSIWRSSRKLRLLGLKGCDNLNSVGNKLSGDPGVGSLRTLVLSGCKQLNASILCVILDGLRSLTSLDLENCCNLEALPDNIGLLSSLQHLLLGGSNVERLSPNIKNLPVLKELMLDNCSKLGSLPELPSSLQVLDAFNCTSLDVDFTQFLVLEHNISFSLKHGLQERAEHAFLPGAKVPDRFSYRAAETSITISHIPPQSDLCGFIFCLILSQSPANSSEDWSAECSIYKHGQRVEKKALFHGNGFLISDHVFLWYYDVSNLQKTPKKRESAFLRLRQKSEAYAHDSISFEFIITHGTGYMSGVEIKECGVCPLYASEYRDSIKQKGLKLELGGGSKDIVELEPNAKSFENQEPLPLTNNLDESIFHPLPFIVKDIDELQTTAIGTAIGGSNRENKDDQESLLHTKKLQGVTTATAEMQDEKEDFNEKSSSDYFITACSSKRKSQTVNDEDYYMSSMPKNQHMEAGHSVKASIDFASNRLEAAALDVVPDEGAGIQKQKSVYQWDKITPSITPSASHVNNVTCTPFSLYRSYTTPFFFNNKIRKIHLPLNYLSFFFPKQISIRKSVKKMMYKKHFPFDIGSNQTVEVSKEKDSTDRQVEKSPSPQLIEKEKESLVEIDTPLLNPDWDPIAELESILSDSYKLSPKSTHSITVQSPNVTAILEKLETLLETSLENLFSDNEVKQQFHHILEQLGQVEDQLPVRLHLLSDRLKIFIEDIDDGFAATQKTIKDYDQLLQSRSLLSKQLESAKAYKDQINSKIFEAKIQFDKINSEIVELEQKLSGLVETRDKLKRAFDHCDDEKTKLMIKAAQWVSEGKAIITALNKNETSYKVALTNKKKAEDEWSDLKKAFVANKI